MWKAAWHKRDNSVQHGAPPLPPSDSHELQTAWCGVSRSVVRWWLGTRSLREHLAREGPLKAQPPEQVAAHTGCVGRRACSKRKSGGLELRRAGGHTHCEVILRLPSSCLCRRHRRRRHGGQGLPVLPRPEQIQLLRRGANLERQPGQRSWGMRSHSVKFPLFKH